MLETKKRKYLEKRSEDLFSIDNTCIMCGKKGFITNPYDKICVYCNKPNNAIISDEVVTEKKTKKKKESSVGVV
ncbi:MAG TPA: hypothetical protein VMZ91_01965 [Candidatus Paceibacterota bacterium]|nr:hypothetical protein [Candidatus Paceibacterota bacterium]